MKDDRTVALDEVVDVGSAKVRVVIEPLQARKTRSIHDVLSEIWAEQDAQGYVPRTRQEIDAELEMERASWDR
jgi:hypothetical protein